MHVADLHVYFSQALPHWRAHELNLRLILGAEWVSQRILSSHAIRIKLQHFGTGNTCCHAAMIDRSSSGTHWQQLRCRK